MFIGALRGAGDTLWPMLVTVGLSYGVTVGGGSDHTLKLDSMKSNNPYNPFLGMWIALRRLPRWRSRSPRLFSSTSGE